MKIDVTPTQYGSCCPYCSSLFSTDSEAAIWNVRILPDSQRIAVVPTRGMLVPGWLLVIPEEHDLSVRALNSLRRDQVWTRVAEVEELIGRAFGPPAVFEHGAAQARSVVGCGVDHAHVHIVPLGFDLLEVAKRHPMGRELRWRELRRIDDWFERPSEEPYLYLRSSHVGSWVATGAIPSQFFRRVIADEIGAPEIFDWRNDAGADHIVRTRDRLDTLVAAAV